MTFSNQKNTLCLALLCTIAIESLSFEAANAAVDLEQRGDEVRVSMDGNLFGTYTVAKELHRPYFREIRAADGTLLTRPIAPPGGDHPHHTGVWHAVDKVNDIEFWHLEGRIENTSVQIVKSGASPAILRVNNRWLAPDDSVVLREQTTIRIFDNRLMLYDIALTAGDKEVTFGDTEEGFFAFRMADSMREEETGQVVNADGLKTAKGCWGKPSSWIDYSGQVDGKTFGAAIFDHPGNFRAARYHVRDYGLFTISPFGEGDYTEGLLPAQPVVLSTGFTLKLRYGIFFHEGDASAAKVPEVYQQFASQPDLAENTGLEVREVKIRSTADGTDQPAMFFAPPSAEKVPLLVVLHTWSGDYRQDLQRACQQWCQDKGWAYIHPNFRGPNNRPEATGSDLAVQDVLDAVSYAARHANVDSTRIYLIGTSGGGYMSLLMAGRHPEIWAAVSSWVPIADLASWYHETKAAGRHYWKDVAASCGGPPGSSERVDQQYKRRSPLTHLEGARGTKLDIHAGIHDGHDGSVPVSHALRAFNEVAVKQDRFTEEEIDYITAKADIPEHLRQDISDPTYGEKQPLLRRHSVRARVTLFDGGHEYIPEPALSWLERQQQVKTPPASAGLAELPAKGPYFPVDERIVEDRWDLSRFVVPLKRHPNNPVMLAEHEWEDTGPNPCTVLRDPDDGLWKMWYMVWSSHNYYNNLPFSYNVCYAESRDGLAWERPPLGAFDYRGSKQNNCIDCGRFKTQQIDVEFLPNRSASEPKFVAIHNDKGGLNLTASDDGKSFRYSMQPAVVVPHHSDTSNNFVYDEIRQRWLLYLRPQAYAGSGVVYDPPRDGLTKPGRRRVAVQESRDLVHWSSPHTVLTPGEDDPEHFYGMQVFRRGDLFFGALQHFDASDQKLTYELVWSGDGFFWRRLPKQAARTLIDVGPPGAFDDGMIGLADRPVEQGDELWFYYGGWDGTHEVKDRVAAVGIATTQRNRLVGVKAEENDRGRLLTRPLPVTGNLWINAAAEGNIAVSVHAVNDDVLPGWTAEDCTPFRGDALNSQITWGDKTLDQLHGQTVRLRFHLERATLYAFDLKK